MKVRRGQDAFPPSDCPAVRVWQREEEHNNFPTKGIHGNLIADESRVGKLPRGQRMHFCDRRKDALL